MTLPAAIAVGEVQAQFASTGASSGGSILVTQAKTAAALVGTFVLSVPPGLRLADVSETGQSMVVTGVRGRVADRNASTFPPELWITLVDYNPVTYLLAAYCAEFHKDNPSTKSVFSIAQTSDASLACAFAGAKRQNLSIQGAQATVWILTDGVSFEQMNQRFPVGAAGWASAMQIVAGCWSVWSGPSYETPSSAGGPVGSSDETAIELAYWDTIKNSNNPEDFKAYLRRYPNGHFADLATNRLAGGMAAPAAAPPNIAATDTWPRTFYSHIGRAGKPRFSQTLYVSPGQVRYETDSKYIKSVTAPCSQLKEWKPEGSYSFIIDFGGLLRAS
jgi:hypothetical protein